MASKSSKRAGIGTAIALIGGAVGTGIVIYALMGGQIGPRSEMVEGGNTGPETTSTDASNADQQAGLASTPTDVQTDAKPSDQPQEDTSITAAPDDLPTTTSDADAQALTETPTTAQSDRDNTARVEASDVGTDTDMASLATPETERTDEDAPQTQDTIQSPSVNTTGEPSVGDAPQVEATDPVMPGADAVVLEAAPAPASDAPRLDPNDPAVPKFDLVRIEADGSAVIAGRASPNSEVQILSNGQEVGTATASARGEFVALITTELTTTAQSLALVAATPDGGRVQSQSNVIVLARTASEIDNLDEEISLAPAIVQATPDSVRVIQPVVGLADLDRVSLDTISYDQSGQVILAGRGRPGFVTRIYADGTSLSDTKISSSGTWSATLNDLDAGRYVIRVDELDLDGNVASRVESPFQRIFPTAEQLALLTNATSVVVQPGNNLWTIAEGRYGEGIRYTTIFEANREQIRDADLIYPGQVFDLPKSAAE